MPKRIRETKIKDPLVYILQLIDELHIDDLDNAMIMLFPETTGNGFVQSGKCKRLGWWKFLADFANLFAAK